MCLLLVQRCRALKLRDPTGAGISLSGGLIALAVSLPDTKLDKRVRLASEVLHGALSPPGSRMFSSLKPFFFSLSFTVLKFCLPLNRFSDWRRRVENLLRSQLSPCLTTDAVRVYLGRSGFGETISAGGLHYDYLLRVRSFLLTLC